VDSEKLKSLYVYIMTIEKITRKSRALNLKLSRDWCLSVFLHLQVAKMF